MHEKYRHFKNDLGEWRLKAALGENWESLLMLSLVQKEQIIKNYILALLKLSRGANLLPKSIVRTIFLPSSSHVHVNPNNLVVPSSHHPSMTENIDDDKFDRNENYLRKIGTKVQNIVSLISQVNEKEVKKRQASNKTLIRPNDLLKATTNKRHRRRNDKFLHRRKPSIADYLIFRDVETSSSSSSTVDYTDCVAVGWGKFQNSGDLSDTLLKIEVPIQNIKRWVEHRKQKISILLDWFISFGFLNFQSHKYSTDTSS